jgi:hypothetical protein
MSWRRGLFRFLGVRLSLPIHSCEPVRFVAGDSLVWNRSLSSFSPADGWVLHYRIIGPYQLASDPSVAVVNGAWQVTLAAAATATDTFIPGTYRLIGWVDGVNSERHAIYDGDIEITPNFATIQYADTIDHIDRMIEACEAALEGQLSANVQRYGREGAFVERLAFKDILSTLGIYKAKRHRRDSDGRSAFVTHGVAFRGDSGINQAAALSTPGFDQ